MRNLLPNTGGKTATTLTQPTASPPVSPSANAAPAGTLVREGLVGLHSSNPFKVEVKALETNRDLTVLKMEITAAGEGGSSSGDFGYDGLPTQSVSFGKFRLFDPVGRKVYFTLRENDVEGRASGSGRRRGGRAAAFGIRSTRRADVPARAARGRAPGTAIMVLRQEQCR
ncbi:hypothetical protein [Nonomuraea aurantiaca]|uniref:hypothetical protein n=1 Tax=Nonomuraea aurantiaca TaxID=2878562 RepID=UPI0021E63F5D|nr:hypothetical protein [Nonomuraea aurantiaca]